MHTEACEATRVHGDQSKELLDLRVRCLAALRGELAGLTAVFAKADGRVVEEAVKAAQDLTPVDGCADIAALRSCLPPPAQRAAQTRAEEARSLLDTAKALVRTGKPREALLPARAALSLAELSGHEPIVADALYRTGIIQKEMGDSLTAEKSLSAAYWRGLSSHSDELAARAAIALVGIDRRTPGKHAEARRWAEDARAVLARGGAPPRLLALLSTSASSSTSTGIRRERSEITGAPSRRSTRPGTRTICSAQTAWSTSPSQSSTSRTSNRGSRGCGKHGPSSRRTSGKTIPDWRVCSTSWAAR
jgi:serine/threonine-protein kinase